AIPDPAAEHSQYAAPGMTGTGSPDATIPGSLLNQGARMPGLPACPQCGSSYTYQDGALLVCPECAHEWSPAEQAEQAAAAQAAAQVRDANGTPLADGDSVVVIKDLKVKGSSLVVKVGTRVRNIRLVE